eukprot:scaffold199665_cov14-Tisochrysis_lutea.AAC.1
MAFEISEIMLGVRTSTPSWSVLKKCGIEPIRFNKLRALHVFTIQPPTATAHFFQRFSMWISLSAPGIPPAGILIFCSSPMAYIMLIFSSRKYAQTILWTLVT